MVVQNRDCTNPEIIEYVARFKNSLYNDFETQIKGNFEAAPATGHNMSEWTSNRDNTHSRICTNSGCTYKETEKCSGGTATYFKKAICDDCKAEHGDFKADTIKPTGEIKLSDNTWNTLLNKITFGRFFSATQKVTIAGTDDSYSSDGFNLSEDAVKISYLLASGDEAKAYTTDELEKRFTAGEFKNIDSKILLRKTVELIASKGYKVGNIDATICAERPKLKAHIPLMQETMANVMGIDVDDISIKATTTEKLGFTGREEGISAYATVLIEKD